MSFWQQGLILVLGLTSFAFFVKALRETKNKRNVYGLTPNLFFLGVFVWGDLIVIGPFWIIISLISLFLNNFYLFLLLVSIFWVVRSFGETVYWLNEQFAVTKRNPPFTLRFHKLINGEAIWFMYQLFWECFFVFSVILSIYFGKMWLESL